MAKDKSKGAGGGGGGIRINNPAGIPSNAITLEEFYALRGVPDSASGVGIDRYAGANLTRFTSRGRQKVHEEIARDNEEYYAKRQAVREEYDSLIKQGKIRDKTPIEKTLTRAHGNPELSATQAARRMVEKRGYDWRTGKKLKRRVTNG